MDMDVAGSDALVTTLFLDDATEPALSESIEPFGTVRNLTLRVGDEEPGSELSVILNFVGAVITGRILPLVDRATLRAVPGLFLFYLVQVLRQSVFDRQAMMEDATSPPPLGIRVQIVGDSDEEDLAGLRALHEEFPWVAIEEVEIILSGN